MLLKTAPKVARITGWAAGCLLGKQGPAALEALDALDWTTCRSSEPVTIEPGRLQVRSTRDEDNPLMDVWEHAYYLKHQDRRIAYLASWWNVVNWNAVAMRMR